ncbi:MAG: crotonase [Planctomycetes bacterium]|jgi:enoyl-CoA hydratase|nr:crotonase [Planctomycetota bacterium]MBT4027929.1 crotonase [Planctomycetota bacterium]MBT4560044.1 crotonase [Planctomycetota bacterium]MBT5120578.1 crotonase [Planctomycetota bacterium]MBT7011483.1 crotonase [Planctomycetota bacterium]
MNDSSSDVVLDDDALVLDWQHLLTDVDESGIATITINRPKALNALNSEVLEELNDALVEAAMSDDVKVIIITGAGDKSFVAGADIGEMADMTPVEARDHALTGQGVFANIESCPKPVIAMINGFALGGGLELAMACHIRVACEGAKLGLPETGLALIPGFGGTQRLMRIVGTGVAREWILTADMFDASEAHRVGLVNRLVPADELLEATMKLAKTLCKRGPVAMETALDCIRRGLEGGQTQGENTEADAFGILFTSEDSREGMHAFLEKRKPAYKGC